MYNTTFSGTKQNKLSQYIVKEVMEATPQQLLIKVYDFAIMNCQKENMVKTNDAIQLLINSLRFDKEEVKEISLGLFRLYQFCQDEMRKRNYDVVYKILVELRETWIENLSKR